MSGGVGVTYSSLSLLPRFVLLVVGSGSGAASSLLASIARLRASASS